jgi:phospholipid/cholesterol/gamma-HCH transport system permease protein
MKKKQKSPSQCGLDVVRNTDGTLSVRLFGHWRLGETPPGIDEVWERVATGAPVRNISFDAEGLAGWDSTLLTFMRKLLSRCAQNEMPVDQEGLPMGAKRLLALAAAVPEKTGTRSSTEREAFLYSVGRDVVAFFQTAGEMLAFIGEASIALLKFSAGKARYRKSDFALAIQECGVKALPIVSLISLLVGLILAFVGAVQLKLFGAEIFVADLVGIAMVRVMGAVMAGIIMAGRTGGAFAAQLGTMEVNEEIDALRTLGVSPIEFLVLPRMLALMLMMPLLCLYADLMGILGGLIVSMSMLDIDFMQYYDHTKNAVRLADLFIGLFQGAVFGVLVALSGCLRGMQCGRSASAVGDAATSAVVTGIVAIIVSTALITIMCSILGV